MKYLGRSARGLLLLAATAAMGQAKDPSPQAIQNRVSPKAVQPKNPDRGQQVFNQNCSRCHNAPEGFPPSVSGTIARHMRVRASLSESDYKALLQFLNP